MSEAVDTATKIVIALIAAGKLPAVPPSGRVGAAAETSEGVIAVHRALTTYLMTADGPAPAVPAPAVPAPAVPAPTPKGTP